MVNGQAVSHANINQAWPCLVVLHECEGRIYVCRFPGCLCRRRESSGCSVPAREEECCCGRLVLSKAVLSRKPPMPCYNSRFPTAAAVSRWASGWTLHLQKNNTLKFLNVMVVWRCNTMEKVGTAFSVFDCQCWGHYSKNVMYYTLLFLKVMQLKLLNYLLEKAIR